MKLERHLSFLDWSTETAEVAARYLRERGFADARADGTVVSGRRGSWLGNLTSFDMTKLRASVSVYPDARGGARAVLEVNTIGQSITDWNRAVWRLELAELHGVLRGFPRLDDVWRRFRPSAGAAASLWAASGMRGGRGLPPEWEAELESVEAAAATPQATGWKAAALSAQYPMPIGPVTLRPIWGHFALWFILGIGWWALPIVVRAAVTEFALADPSRARHVNAEITDWRHYEGRAEVKYRFRVPGDARQFTASDDTGRTDLWQPISTSELGEDALLPVRYLPDNPWRNRPVDAAGTPRADATTAVVLVAGLCAAWSAGLLLVVRNHKKCRRFADEGSVVHLLFWRATRLAA